MTPQWTPAGPRGTPLASEPGGRRPARRFRGPLASVPSSSGPWACPCPSTECECECVCERTRAPVRPGCSLTCPTGWFLWSPPPRVLGGAHVPWWWASSPAFGFPPVAVADSCGPEGPGERGPRPGDWRMRQAPPPRGSRSHGSRGREARARRGGGAAPCISSHTRSLRLGWDVPPADAPRSRRPGPHRGGHWPSVDVGCRSSRSQRPAEGTLSPVPGRHLVTSPGDGSAPTSSAVTILGPIHAADAALAPAVHLAPCRAVVGTREESGCPRPCRRVESPSRGRDRHSDRCWAG